MALNSISVTNLPESDTTNLTSDLASKAPIASPSFTGVATAPQIAANGLAVSGSITVSALPDPSGTPTGTAGGSGTLAAGANYCKIVAVDGEGNTTSPGTESASVTSSGTNGITWNWTAVAGAISYQIWVSATSGTEAKYFTSTTNSYFQSTAISSGTSGTIPAANTTGSFTGLKATLGASGTLGSITMGNATSGLLTLEPVTGALGTVTVSIPAATDTLVNLAGTQSLSNKTLTSPTLSGTVAGANTVPLSILSQIGSYSILGNSTSGTANVAAIQGYRLLCGYSPGTATSSATLSIGCLGGTQGNFTQGLTNGAMPLMPTAGICYGLYVSCGVTGVSSSSGVFTVQKQAAGSTSISAQTMTITYGTTTANTMLSDTTHTFTFAAGDRIGIKVTTQGSETLADASVTLLLS